MAKKTIKANKTDVKNTSTTSQNDSEKNKALNAMKNLKSKLTGQKGLVNNQKS